jgi:hypothetical protein
MRQKVDPEKLKLIRASYDRGNTPAQIGKVFGFTGAWVSVLLRRTPGEIRGRGYNKKKAQPGEDGTK